MPATKPITTLPVFTITKENERKAFLHPVRSKILGHLVQSPQTISQVALKLGVHPANITHHFKLLEKCKLIFLQEKRDIGRVIEHYYAASGKHYEILPPPGSVKNANAEVLTFLRNDLSQSIALLKADDSEAAIGMIKPARIKAASFVKFAKKIQNLIAEFEQEDSADGESYALNLSLYPHKVDYGPLGRIEIRKASTPLTKKLHPPTKKKVNNK